MNILLIEDNETLAKGLIYLLEQNKYKAIHTLNIKESINYLSKNRPDLIILDASLPDGNGFDLYDKEIKQRKINTIFLTAKDDEDDIVRGLELGAEDFTAEENVYEIITAPSDFSAIREELEKQGLEFLEAEVQMVPSTTVALDEKGAEKMEKLIDRLNDLDDVMNVYHNWEE